MFSAHLISLVHWWHSSLLSYILYVKDSTQSILALRTLSLVSHWGPELALGLVLHMVKEQGLVGRARGMKAPGYAAWFAPSFPSSGCSKNSMFSFPGTWAEPSDPSIKHPSWPQEQGLSEEESAGVGTQEQCRKDGLLRVTTLPAPLLTPFPSYPFLIQRPCSLLLPRLCPQHTSSFCTLSRPLLSLFLSGLAPLDFMCSFLWVLHSDSLIRRRLTSWAGFQSPATPKPCA